MFQCNLCICGRYTLGYCIFISIYYVILYGLSPSGGQLSLCYLPRLQNVKCFYSGTEFVSLYLSGFPYILSWMSCFFFEKVESERLGLGALLMDPTVKLLSQPWDSNLWSSKHRHKILTYWATPLLPTWLFSITSTIYYLNAANKIFSKTLTLSWQVWAHVPNALWGTFEHSRSYHLLLHPGQDVGPCKPKYPLEVCGNWKYSSSKKPLGHSRSKFFCFCFFK